MQTVAVTASNHTVLRSAPTSTHLWVGRVLSAVAMLFLAVDTAMKLFMVPAAVEASKALGYTEGAILAIGAIETVCLLLYVVPRTAVLGAVLWTGYLGGAIATHVRAGSPLLSHMLFPVYVAVLLWVGLWLRDARVRRIVKTALESPEKEVTQ